MNPDDTQVASILDQLAEPRRNLLLEVEGCQISLSNLDKEFWPARHGPRPLTKRDLLVYLTRTSGCLLHHLRDRPLTLTRYPDGMHGEHFYQKHWNHSIPEFVNTVAVYSESKAEFRDYLLCNNLATLLWLGQIANLEFHTWYSRIKSGADVEMVLGKDAEANDILNYPDFIVFDLDPYIYSGEEAEGDEPQLNRIAYARTCEAAHRLRQILDSLRMSSFVKTSGRTGLHIYVPIVRRFDFDAVRSVAENIGRALVGLYPQEITMEWSVVKRTGKVFFDYNQNVRGKTLASVYSPRPAPDGVVSMPLRWEDLDTVYPTDFTLLTVPARLEEVGDIWRYILEHRCNLQDLAEAGSLDRSGSTAGSLMKE